MTLEFFCATECVWHLLTYTWNSYAWTLHAWETDVIYTCHLKKKTMWKFERKLISSMYYVFTCTFWNFLYMINCWKLFFCKNWTIQSIFPVIHVRMYPTMVFSFCWFHLLMQCNRTLKVGFVTWYQHYRELL